MAADKVRIYEVAKQLQLSSNEVIDLLDKKLGIKVKSHSSSITHDEVKKLSAALKTAKAPIKEEKPAKAPSAEKTLKSKATEEKTDKVEKKPETKAVQPEKAK